MSLRAFLVEDNAIIRENLIPALSELAPVTVAGHADNEKEALHWLCETEDRWDLVIVDIFLRHGSGLDVLAGCRTRQRHQHAIVLTNYATKEVRHQCLALGAEAVFDKSTELEAMFDFCLSLAAGRERERKTQDA